MSAPDWQDFKRLLDGERLPAALVDLDAVLHNADVLLERLGPGKTLRVASKSVRHTGLLRRILAHGGDRFQGLMCFTAEEACFLADAGFDDLLVAYPTAQHAGLVAAAQRVHAGTTLRLMVDATSHVDAAAAAAREVGTELPLLLDIDVSWRPMGGVHVGARRSPLRTVDQAVALARTIGATDGVRLEGVMAYEGHIAGVQDNSPFGRATNLPKRWMKAMASPHVARTRAEVVAALLAEGVDVKLVNGGGTGSVRETSGESVVTEVAAGSGFVCSHLFSYFFGLELQPALFFALEASRISDAGYVTCSGGGYIASGEPGWDRLPVPWLPEGLGLLGLEGAGEVQTPLSVGPQTPAIHVGDPVIFRPAKAGEPAERFREYLLISGGEVVAREPTYRGEGHCFL